MSRVVGMEVIPIVVVSTILCWMVRVMCRSILVDNTVATAPLATNKAVDLLPFLLLRRRPGSCAVEWSQGRTDEANLSVVRTCDQSL